jgi:hypothetical protein
MSSETQKTLTLYIKFLSTGKLKFESDNDLYQSFHGTPKKIEEISITDGHATLHYQKNLSLTIYHQNEPLLSFQSSEGITKSNEKYLSDYNPGASLLLIDKRKQMKKSQLDCVPILKSKDSNATNTVEQFITNHYTNTVSNVDEETKYEFGVFVSHHSTVRIMDFDIEKLNDLKQHCEKVIFLIVRTATNDHSFSGNYKDVKEKLGVYEFLEVYYFDNEVKMFSTTKSSILYLEKFLKKVMVQQVDSGAKVEPPVKAKPSQESSGCVVS